MNVLWTCTDPACGAANHPKARVCESCGAERGGVEKAEASWMRCQRCGNDSKSTNVFYDDGAPEDRGQRLCSGCSMLALKRRAARDPISAEELGQLIAKIRADVARIEERIVSRRRAEPKATPEEVRL